MRSFSYKNGHGHFFGHSGWIFVRSLLGAGSASTGVGAGVNWGDTCSCSIIEIPFEISCGRAQHLTAILEKPDCPIASRTEETSYFSSDVVMINIKESLEFTSWFEADGTCVMLTM